MSRIRLAIEPTNRYHQTVAEAAHTVGHQVCMIDPYRLVHYREGVGQRVKAGRQDAKLLARYLSREDGEIRRWAPMTQAEQRFWHLATSVEPHWFAREPNCSRA